ncbi:Schizosaccharomyces specific protein [Schizosaccharomyces osmophilus]|uniref:Schizosaccharomyces specific protein n=1 Tax=Schizosaccharomyces osmophilus TaxID=2545709 RepID=A0AAF0AV77_9SCHI|nr:Schizosaccharomyces specific protein [Schizosaccharomyces osmophilus]WBW71690.1 Schizosaccharomyces specific protein [Schizosaccharomyces osmophilus]
MSFPFVSDVSKDPLEYEYIEEDMPMGSSTPTKSQSGNGSSRGFDGSHQQRLQEALFELNQESMHSIHLSIDESISENNNILNDRELQHPTSSSLPQKDAPAESPSKLKTPMSSCFEEWLPSSKYKYSSPTKSPTRFLAPTSPTKRGIPLMAINANQITPKNRSLHGKANFENSSLPRSIDRTFNSFRTPSRPGLRKDSPSPSKTANKQESLKKKDGTRWNNQSSTTNSIQGDAVSREDAASETGQSFNASPFRSFMETTLEESLAHDDATCPHLVRLEKFRELLSFVQLELQCYVDPYKKELREAKEQIALKDQELEILRTKLKNAGLS